MEKCNQCKSLCGTSTSGEMWLSNEPAGGTSERARRCLWVNFNIFCQIWQTDDALKSSDFHASFRARSLIKTRYELILLPLTPLIQRGGDQQISQVWIFDQFLSIGMIPHAEAQMYGRPRNHIPRQRHACTLASHAHCWHQHLAIDVASNCALPRDVHRFERWCAYFIFAWSPLLCVFYSQFYSTLRCSRGHLNRHKRPHHAQRWRNALKLQPHAFVHFMSFFVVQNVPELFWFR